MLTVFGLGEAAMAGVLAVEAVGISDAMVDEMLVELATETVEAIGPVLVGDVVSVPGGIIAGEVKVDTI